MSDGHSGISNHQVNEASPDSFRLVLSYLKTAGQSTGMFVIHATSDVVYSAGIQPRTILEYCGLAPFRGECQFFHERCWYRDFATVAHDHDVPQVHGAFLSFAEGLPELRDLRSQELRILGQIGLDPGPLRLFASTPPELVIGESATPPWIEDMKYDRLKELDQQIDELRREAQELNRFLPLLFATGVELEVAVLEAMRFLGLEAEMTEPGFTADILAHNVDETIQLGIEVTGVVGAVKKDSNKLTQVLEFERIKEHNETTVLLANTHRALPPSERADLVDFTPEVVDFLGPHKIVLMTGLDLYRMVGEIIDGSADQADLVEMIYQAEGRISRG